MDIKNVKVYGLPESIVRSGYAMAIGEPEDIDKRIFRMTAKDTKRADKLANTPAGSGHSNYRKGIIVQFDLQYSQYFTPQLQRYNWITIISSQSKMHKLLEIKHIGDYCNKFVHFSVVNLVNDLIHAYNNNQLEFYGRTTEYSFKFSTKIDLFYAIISNLPSGYELWMGISTNYEQLATIYRQRKNHKLIYDWVFFCNWIKTLPMSELITNEYD